VEDSGAVDSPEQDTCIPVTERCYAHAAAGHATLLRLSPDYLNSPSPAQPSPVIHIGLASKQ
jgi:hypothetical protein